ncbi:MAG: DUF3667 domain-containing protein [Chitinophagaceae bacterium]|nr:DUF3667 domain-containing protein [Chitinophagaceae bacterium]
MVSCKNCGEKLFGNFCSHCGQKADIHRINWHHLAHSIPHALFHVDSGILFTLKELALRPGHAAFDFLSGKRKPYYHPVFILILVSGLCSVLYAAWHIPTFFASVRLDVLEHGSPMLAHKFFALRVAFMIMICSVGDFFIFRKQGYYFPELIIFNCFVFGGIMIMQLLLAPLRFLGMDSAWETIFFVLQITLQIGYCFWGRYQFFKAAGKTRLMVQILCAIALYVLLIALTGMFIVKPFLKAL